MPSKPRRRYKDSRADPRPCARWMPVIADVCRRHRVSPKELFQGFKDESIVPCRHEVWWTLRNTFGSSYPQIGQRMGGYHHTSILHGVRKHQERLDAARSSAQR